MTETLIIAVTGGTGFVGQHLIRHLRAAGHTVRALTRREAVYDSDPNLVWISGDLDDSKALGHLMERADVLVHGAGAIKALSRAAFFKINRDGVRAVAEAAIKSDVPRFVLVSSLAAREPLLSDYAASKRAGEIELDVYRDRLTPIILRPPAIYGPGDRETAPLFQMAAKGLVAVPGGKDATFSLIHVSDVVTAIQACCELEQPEAPLEIDDDTPGGYRWSEVVQAAGEALGRPPRIVHLPTVLVWFGGLVGSIKGFVTRQPAMLSLSKVPELLHPNWLAAGPKPANWSPKVVIKEGFATVVDWYTSQNVVNRYL